MKKFLSVLICAILLAGILIGCGKAPTAQPTMETTPQDVLMEDPPVVVPRDESTETVDPPPSAPQEPQSPPETLPPVASEPEDAKPVCTLSIRCDTILKNIAHLDETKRVLIPSDGFILAATPVPFAEGESVFDLLLRETRENNIHLEFENTPIYNTAYIKGIANLYERDCGEGSGWLYRVNGEIPKHGCSQHVLQPGDVVEWIYTCHHGDDID